MEAAPALPDGVRPTCKFFLVLTADQREICYPAPGVSAKALSVRMLSLGDGARDEVHVLEAEGAKGNGKTVSQAAMKLSLQPCQPVLGLGVNLTPPVTFRLKTGPGPLFISGLVAEEESSDPVAMVTEEEVAEPPVSQDQEGARDSSVDLQIVKSLKDWKRLHEMHAICTGPTPGVEKATETSQAKKLCQGLSVSSPEEQQVTSGVNNSAQCSKAKELCQGTNVCHSPGCDVTIPVENGAQSAGAKHLGASISKSVKRSKKKSKKQLMKLNEKKVPLTTDEIKDEVQQSLINGDKIPIQILKFRDYLQRNFKYEDQGYNHLVELWRWRLSLYKTYG